MLLVLVLLAACSSPPATQNSVSTPDAGMNAIDGSPTDDAGPSVFEATQVVFDYGDWTIPTAGEQYPCAQWTLNNEEPLYVTAVVQANDGGFHHSNWYAVKDDLFPGEDGFFECRSRNFEEEFGAVFGEVVFAQSTQAYVETQRFPEGVVIKIPPHSKIIGGVHLLNVSASPLDTGVRMGLELVHPKDVQTVATPWRLDNSNLFIPPREHTRWSIDCDMKDQYEFKNDEPFEPLIYWILPHYHALGDYFRVDLIKPEGDETILELSGFNAEGNGVTFPEPISMAGATGMRMVCGYTNPYNRMIYYGTEGDDEMCTLLAFTNAAMRLNAQTWEELSVDQSEGHLTHHGDCGALFLPKNEGQQMPTQEEIDGELYVPESNTTGEVTLVPECEDTPPSAEPSGAVTLSSLRTEVFGGSCAYSSCHDQDSPAAGLDFTSPNLHAALLGHEVQGGTDLPLVTAGSAEQSWLYQIISTCSPGEDERSMPANSPRLLPHGDVARVREWIAAGALDD
jgi:hypothetical protein